MVCCKCCNVKQTLLIWVDVRQFLFVYSCAFKCPHQISCTTVQIFRFMRENTCLYVGRAKGWKQEKVEGWLQRKASSSNERRVPCLCPRFVRQHLQDFRRMVRRSWEFTYMQWIDWWCVRTWSCFGVSARKSARHPFCMRKPIYCSRDSDTTQLNISCVYLAELTKSSIVKRQFIVLPTTVSVNLKTVISLIPVMWE